MMCSRISAKATFQESLLQAKIIEDGYCISLALSSLATTLAEAEKDYQQAWDLYQESLAIYREIQYQHGIGKALNYLGQAAYLNGDYRQARSLIQESCDLSREAGNRRQLADSLKQLGNVARASGSSEEAKNFYREAIQLARQIEAEQLILAVLLENAVSHQQTGESHKARLLASYVATHPGAGQELAEAAQKVAAQQALASEKEGHPQAQTLTIDTAVQLALGHTAVAAGEK